MKRQGTPHEGELVICRISSINPNSAFAHIEGYDKDGMIHVSEVAGRWVRDIRTFVRENQLVVCRVLKVEGGHISLSKKRVSREDAASRINEFKREQKSEKLLELAAKHMGTKPDRAYEDIGDALVESFGSLTKAFDIASKSPDMLPKRGIAGDWAKAIADVAAKSKSEKVHELRAELELVCYGPEGIDAIKGALLKQSGFGMKYVSAPRYILSSKGHDRRLMEAELSRAAGSIIEELKKSGGHGSFRIVEN